jgi:hypothetical protein
MASTSKGISYPTSGDNIAPLETHFASLAQTTNDAIIDVETEISAVDSDLQDFKSEVGLVGQEGSFAFTGPTSSAAPVNVVVPLTSGYFPVAPVVVASVNGSIGSSPYLAMLHSRTTVSFQARIWRIADGAAESLNLNWIAK